MPAPRAFVRAHAVWFAGGVALALGVIVGGLGGHAAFPRTKTVTRSVFVDATVQVDPMSGSDLALARRVAPILTFDDSAGADPWRPQRVDKFLCESSLTGERAVRTIQTPDAAHASAPAGQLPRPVDGCTPDEPGDRRGGCERSWPLAHTSPPTPCTLDLGGCTLHDLNCYRDLYGAQFNDARPTMYVRELTATDPAVAQVPFTDARLSRLTRVFQYWLFYPFDDWQGPSLQQAHEGDWEFVVVGVSGDSPLFVGYSEHCFGAWRWWQDAEHGTGAGQDRPVVYVAAGSHANYPHAGRPGVDIWHCALGRPLQTQLQHLGDLHDVTVSPARAPAAVAAAAREPVDVVQLDGKAKWVLFAGSWGEGEALRIAGHWRAVGPGPAGPARQGAAWDDTVRTMLCGAWFGDGPSVCAGALTGSAVLVPTQ